MLKLRNYQQKIVNSAAKLNNPLVVAPCGAGKTIMFISLAQQLQAEGKSVWFLVHRRELLQQANRTFERLGVARTNIYTSMVMKTANLPKPDVIIFDEAHRSQARTWKRIINAYPNANIIGLTATPARLDGKPLGDIYNEIVEEVTTRDLIEQGYLADYDYYSVTLSDINNLANGDRTEAAKLLSGQTQFAKVIETYSKLAKDKQAIVFCSNIEHSKATAEAFKSAGYAAEHIDGTTSIKTREKRIERFRDGNTQVLCNVDLLSEGFDLDTCEVVVQLRPTDSLTIYLQQVGRALRPREGKRAVIIDHVGNYLRHGLPDTEHEWTLERGADKFQAFNEDGTFSIRQCPNCYAVYMADKQSCPLCGTAYAKTAIERKRIASIELSKIEQEQIEHERKKRENRAEELDGLDDCKTFKDVHIYLEKHGYEGKAKSKRAIRLACERGIPNPMNNWGRRRR